MAKSVTLYRASGLMALAVVLTLSPSAVAQTGFPAGAIVQPLPDPNDPEVILASNLKILASNPYNVDALLAAGQGAINAGDPNAAIGFLARAEELSPRNGRVKAALGSALIAFEKPSEALRMFGEATALGIPEYAVAKDRGLAWDLRGDPARAQADYALALKGYKDDEITRRYALSLANSGKKDVALKLLDPLTKKGDQAAWRARAFVYAMNGEQGEADKIIRAVMAPNMAGVMTPFLQQLPRLSFSQRAQAVNFGTMPAASANRPVLDPGDSFRSVGNGSAVGLAQSVEARPNPAREAPQETAKERKAREKQERALAKIAARNGRTLPAARPAPVPAAPVVKPLPQPVKVAVATPAPQPERPLLGPSVLAPPKVEVKVSAASVPAPLPAPVKIAAASVELPKPLPAPIVAPPATVVSALVTAASAPVVTTPAPVVQAPKPEILPPSQVATAPSTPFAIPPAGAPTPSAVVATPIASPPPIASPVPEVVKPVPAPVVSPPVSVVPSPVIPAPGFDVPKPVVVTPATQPSVTAAVITPVTAPVVAAPKPVVEGPPAPALALPTPTPTPTATVPPSVVPAATSPFVIPPPEPMEQVPSAVLSEAAEATPSVPVAEAMPAPEGLGAVLSDLPVETESAAGPLPTDEEFRKRQLDAKRKEDARKKAEADAKAKDVAAEKEKLAQEAAEKKEAEEKAAELKRHPSRIWVQIATGSNRGALGFDWKRLRGKAPKALDGQSAWTSPLRATNRLLIGPFKSNADARAKVNALAKDGIQANTHVSDTGQEVTRLGGK